MSLLGAKGLPGPAARGDTLGAFPVISGQRVNRTHKYGLDDWCDVVPVVRLRLPPLTLRILPRVRDCSAPAAELPPPASALDSTKVSSSAPARLLLWPRVVALREVLF